MVDTCFYIQFFQPCLSPGPGKSDSDTDSRVKVRASRVKSGSQAGAKGDSIVGHATDRRTRENCTARAGQGGTRWWRKRLRFFGSEINLFLNYHFTNTLIYFHRA